MIIRRFGSDTLVVAVVGGVVTDMAGFLAATYAREVPFRALRPVIVESRSTPSGRKPGNASNLLGVAKLDEAGLSRLAGDRPGRES